MDPGICSIAPPLLHSSSRHNLFDKDHINDNFKLFELVARQLEVQFFEEQLEKLKTATNDQGRDWLRGLLRERDKWSRVYDHGG